MSVELKGLRVVELLPKVERSVTCVWLLEPVNQVLLCACAARVGGEGDGGGEEEFHSCVFCMNGLI